MSPGFFPEAAALLLLLVGAGDDEEAAADAEEFDSGPLLLAPCSCWSLLKVSKKDPSFLNASPVGFSLVCSSSDES